MTKTTRRLTAKQARQETRPFGYMDAMKSIEEAIINQENKALIYPAKLLDENLKEELMIAGYKTSYFTDNFCGLQGLLIEW